MKQLLIVIIIGLAALPLGWKYSSFLAEPAADTVAGVNTGVKLVVVDPPSNFKSVAEGLGFFIEQENILPELSMKTVTLRLPSGLTAETATAALEKHFPGIIIDEGEFAS